MAFSSQLRNAALEAEKLEAQMGRSSLSVKKNSNKVA